MENQGIQGWNEWKGSISTWQADYSMARVVAEMHQVILDLNSSYFILHWRGITGEKGDSQSLSSATPLQIYSCVQKFHLFMRHCRKTENDRTRFLMHGTELPLGSVNLSY